MMQVAFTLTRPADYAFEVYDVRGRRVFERAFHQGVPNSNRFAWDGSTDRGHLESGVYFYVISARYQTESVKTSGRLVILK